MEIIQLRASMAKQQAHLFMMEADIAQDQYKVDQRKKYLAMALAIKGQWQRPLPHDTFMNIVEFLEPAHGWIKYTCLTWSASDPLLPHDPMHAHRGGLRAQIHLPDDQEICRLRERQRIMCVIAADYLVMKQKLTDKLSRLDHWIAWMDFLLLTHT